MHKLLVFFFLFAVVLKMGQATGRLQTSITTDDQCSVVLRQSGSTVQLMISSKRPGSQDLVKFTSNITKESIVDVFATVVKTAPLEACSVPDVGLAGIQVWVVSAARPDLPFLVEDANRPEIDDPEAIRVDLETRLDNRVLDLRTPTNQAVFRIQAGVCRLFRDSLTRRGFFEVHVPKLVTGTLDDRQAVPYFNKTVCLSATHQFYKQMAVAGDFDKIFSIGTVFRSEDFISHRHLTEFIGLDLEMTFKHHYHEVLDVIGETFVDIFRGLREQYASEIETVSRQFKVEPLKFQDPPLRLEFPQGVEMLMKAGVTVADDKPLSMAQEKVLGRIVRDEYDTDFFILDKYPVLDWNIWVMPDPHNPKLSNAYDMFMRGEEVLSGCQRIHDQKLLLERSKSVQYDMERLKYYTDSFQYGCPPHAGGGMGLERLVMLFLGLNDIRKTSMFPRDYIRRTP